MPSRVETEELAKAKEKIGQLLPRFLPESAPIDISICARENFAGENSLFVQVVLATSPTADDVPRQFALRREFQRWLVAEFGDERFPYFEFVGESDLQERDRAQ